MKKTTKIGKAPAIRAALAICAALALALALSGCDNNASPDGGNGNLFVGTWDRYGSAHPSVLVISAGNWTDTITATGGTSSGTFTLTSDTTANFTGSVSGTWTLSGNANTLTWTQTAGSLTFHRRQN